VRQIGNLDLLMLRFSAGVGWTGPRAHWLDPLPCGLATAFSPTWAAPHWPPSLPLSNDGLLRDVTAFCSAARVQHKPGTSCSSHGAEVPWDSFLDGLCMEGRLVTGPNLMSVGSPVCQPADWIFDKSATETLRCRSTWRMT
jgi:hypothetical protein